MPAPLMPLLAGAIARLTVANMGRAGAALASRLPGAAARVGSPATARSGFQFLQRFRNQQKFRAAGKRWNQFRRNAPGFGQEFRFRKFRKAWGSFDRARARKANEKWQILHGRGNPQKLVELERKEADAKARLTKRTEELLTSMGNLQRSVVRTGIVLYSLPGVIQSIGRSRVETIRENGWYAPRTAASLARYDISEKLNSISSARRTSKSDSRVVDATARLNQSLLPIQQTGRVIINEVLTKFLDTATKLNEAVKKWEVLTSTTLWWFGHGKGPGGLLGENKKAQPAGNNDPAKPGEDLMANLRGRMFVTTVRAAQDRNAEWEKLRANLEGVE